MTTDISIKKETITEAAMRRFSHFGVNKTTLNEIASDLNISKTALFYYFNDKEALIIAVFEKLVEDFLSSYKEKITDDTSAEDALFLLIDSKQEFYKNNMQLALQAGSVQIDHRSTRIMKPIVKAQKDTRQIISSLIDKGIRKGHFQDVDSKKVAAIILETIQSHEICLKHSSPFPSEKDLDDLAKKQKQTIQLFFSGINQVASENQHS